MSEPPAVVEKPVMRHWWLVRHAPVTSSVLYGQRDVAASMPSGEIFTRLAAVLPEKAEIYSSDLGRCRMTATALARALKVDPSIIQAIPEFREQHFGDWEGKTYSQIEQEYPAEYQEFWEAPALKTPPGGESFAGMAQRVCDMRLRLQGCCDKQDHLLIAHAGTIRALVGDALGLAPDKALSLVIDPLSLTRLTSYGSAGSESWAVTCVNRPFMD